MEKALFSEDSLTSNFRSHNKNRSRKAPVFIHYPIPNFQFQSRSYCYSQLLLLLPVIVPLEPPPAEGTSLINLEFPFSKLFRKCSLLESGINSLCFLGRSECGRFKTRVLRNTGGVYADIRRGFPKGDNAEDYRPGWTMLTGRQDFARYEA